MRQLQWELPDEDCLVIHLTLVPYLSAAKELKTKPTQHSVKLLQQDGVQQAAAAGRSAAGHTYLPYGT